MTVAQGTPRTDQAAIEMSGTCEDDEEGQAVVGIRFARELERENAALSAQVVELQKDAERYKFLKKQNDEPSCTMGIWAEIDSGTEYPGEEVVDIWIDRRIDAANPVHSTVTRASVPPSVSDGGTTAAVIAYIDGFYVSGNSVPIDRPWINAESWGIAKELLALGLPLEHALIEQECVYRRKLRAYGNETRAKSPLQERLGMINTRTAIKIEVPNE